MAAKNFKVVNHSVAKKDAMSLALGKKMYVADFAPDDALIAKMLWSPHAHARIKSIDASEAEKMEGVCAVLHHGNVPRIPHTTAGQGYPEPSPYDTVMFDDKVRFVGDRVAAVAARTAEIAEEAVSRIKVEYEVLEPVLSIDAALKEGSPVIHDQEDASIPIPVPYEPKKNIAARVGMDHGDLEKGLAEGEVRFDETYETHYAQHCPMEPHVCLAYLDSADRLVLMTSTQVPFHARRIAAQTLDIPVRRIRVIKPRIGGGFGAKQEVLLEDVTGMLALRTRKPVLLEYTRAEEFVSSRTRHPIRTRLRMAAKKDGTLTAFGMDCISNTGAYGTHGLTVVCNCGSKCLPLYRSPNVHFTGTTVYTNLPVGGAYRGYGATQAAFAVELHMDRLAEALDMDPLDIRRKNHIKSGESSPVFAALGEGKAGVTQKIGSNELAKCIREGAREIGWKRRRHHSKKKGRYRRGLGVATLMQGSAIPEIDMGSATIKMNDDGSFNLIVGATDLGTGSDTVLSQIACEVLGVDMEQIVIYSSDTDLTPFDVGAYASSTTFLSGNAVRKAAMKVAKQIIEVASEMTGQKPSELELRNSKVVKKGGGGKEVAFAEVALRSLYGQDQFQIADTASHVAQKSPPPFSAHFAEVEVDTYTGRVRVIKYVAAVDCGTAINPALAEGQTEGGLMNGISYALTEEYRFSKEGVPQNPNLLDYRIYALRDMPEIKTILIPSYENWGPFGAKSVSEICINGPAPAIANAIYNAVGARITTLPITREKVFRAMQTARK